MHCMAIMVSWFGVLTTGRLVVVEHVAHGPGSTGRRVQDLLNGVWGLVSGGCNLNHTTDCILSAASPFTNTHNKGALGTHTSLFLPFTFGVLVKN